VNKALLSLVFFTACAASLLAQEIVTDPKTDNLIERKIETIAENSSEDIDYTTLFENLAFYREHPLDLNYASAEDLQQLFILTDFQIANLINHRVRFGKLLSIYELQAVEGFDLPLIYQLQAVVRVDRSLNRLNISVKDILKYADQSVITRVSQVVQQQKGFSPITDEALAESPNSRFLGSQQRIFTRYRLRYGNYVSLGFTAEKDACEQLFKGTQKKGFDFYTGHFALQNIGKLKSLNVGDYQAQFGQGLTFWSGFAFGKTADAMNIKRTGQGLKPYTSVNENLFLRGIATTWSLGKFEITAFGSNKKVNTNASAIDSLSQDIQSFSNFNLSGFHRTASEILDKGNIREQIFGGHIAYKKRNLNIGITAADYSYSADLTRSDVPYNKFDFSGRKNTNIGIDYNWIYRNINFFGEVARSANGGMAMSHGLIAALDPRLSVSVLHRNFGRDYHSIYNSAIAEGSRNINEVGTYIGFVAKPMKYVSVSAYFDHWKYPWLKFLVDGPSSGYDGLVQINYTPSKTVDMYIRYRDKTIARNVTGEDDLDMEYVIAQHQKKLRFDIIYKVSPSFRFRNRIEYVAFTQPNARQENGIVILQDVIYKPLSMPISFSARYALFDTDGFNSRIYSYENDVLYSFSIPAYFYKGSRSYINVEYNLGRNVDIWFRYAQFFYSNRDVTGSGLTETQGPLRGDFRVQVRLKW